MKIINYLKVELNNETISENVNFECNELIILSLSKRKTGAGHYELSLEIEIDGNHEYYKKTTTDMGMIDNMTDEDDSVSDEAISDAVYTVLNSIEIE